MNIDRLRRIMLPSLILVTLMACGHSAWSQSGTPAGRPTGITMDQFVARQTARMMAADTDGDRRISRAEMLAMAAKNGHDGARRFDAMDTNHDGYLDNQEIRSALERRFRHMDSNSDGILTPDERKAAHARQPSANTADLAASQP